MLFRILIAVLIPLLPVFFFQFFVGTIQGNIYNFKTGDFSPKLLTTCHYDAVSDVAFP